MLNKSKSNVPWRTEAQRRSIPTLDGWRALAVLLVIASHSQTMLLNNGSSVARALAAFVNHGGYGVDIFFALSGFLITTLLLLEKETAGSINLKAFYTRRAFRIIPPIIAYLTAICVLNAFWPLGISRQEIVSVLLFFRNYVNGSWYTGHFWSLAIEEHFYLFVPLIVLLLPWRKLLLVFFTAALACAAIRWVENGLVGGKVDFRTEARFDALMYGSALAVMVSRPAIRAWLVEHVTATRCGILLIVLVATLFTLPYMPLRRTLVSICLPLFIVSTTLHPAQVLSRMLDVPFIRWIGRLSYSLYIWQMPFLVPWDRPLPAVQDFPLNLFCAGACAVVCYYFVERPTIKIGHALSKRFTEIPLSEGIVKGQPFAKSG